LELEELEEDMLNWIEIAEGVPVLAVGIDECEEANMVS
jgi:hypothetical protein